MSLRFSKVYRHALTQAIILGLLSFTQPGIWDAISGMGAGGLETVETANASQAITFGLMVVVSPFFAIFTNKLGVEPVISFGTIGFVFWSAGLYLNSKNGTQSLIIAGAAICGVTASAFWIGETTVAILYPQQSERGLFIGIWQAINKIGSLIAGAITLALNINDNKGGKVGLSTYIALIAIQCLGFPLSFLLSSPEKVRRSDNSAVKSNIRNKTLKEEVVLFYKVLQKKETMCLAPIFLSFAWFNTWQSNYTTHHFSVRARALSSFLSAIITGVTDIFSGYVYDLKYFKRSTRIKYSWTIVVILMTGFIIFSLVVQKGFDSNPESGIDWSGNLRFIRNFVPFQVFRISKEALPVWVYWVIGAYQFRAEEIAYVSSLLRLLESLGECLSFVVGAVNSNDMINLAVSVGIFYLSVLPVTYVVLQTEDNQAEHINHVNDTDKLDLYKEQGVNDQSYKKENINVKAVQI